MVNPSIYERLSAKAPDNPGEVTKIQDLVRNLCDSSSWPRINTDQPVKELTKDGLHGIATTEDAPEQVDAELLLWPPDLFAIAASLLRNSAGYLSLANDWPPLIQELGFLLDGPKGSGGLNSLLAPPPPGNGVAFTHSPPPSPEVLRVLQSLCDTEDWRTLDQPSPELRLAVYHWAITRVAFQWRDACRLAALAPVEGEATERQLDHLSKRHGFRDPAHAVMKLPVQVLHWWNLVRFNSLTPIISIGLAQRPPNSKSARHVVGSSYTSEGFQCTQDDFGGFHSRDQWGQWRPDANTYEDLCEEARRTLLARSLLLILAASDECCAGMGLRIHNAALRTSAQGAPIPLQLPDPLLIQAMAKLTARMVVGGIGGLPATLCRRVMSRRCVVLPKLRTPRSGMTIRSLSHHLAHVPGSEAWAKWHVKSNSASRDDRPTREADSLRLLLVPWPPRVLPRQFSRSPGLDGATAETRTINGEHFGFFHYAIDERFDEAMSAHIFSVLENARRTCGDIDGIILPELACSHETLAHFAWRLIDSDHKRLLSSSKNKPTADDEDRHGLRDAAPVEFIVGGVLASGPGLEPHAKAIDGSMPENTASVYLRFPGAKAPADGAPLSTPDEAASIGPRWYRQQQPKHHRWHIDGRQVVQYNLGAILAPHKTWVEGINLPRRSLHFWMLEGKIAMAVLVCEDLAQADPIGDVVRAVAPNLVIALLADGPQLGDRWPARYASTLADDPGSSVLTLTSRGMANLSRAENGRSQSDVVALWRDREGGTRQLELPPDHDALVLSIHLRSAPEVTADGRLDQASGPAAVQAIFGGLLPVKALPGAKSEPDALAMTEHQRTMRAHADEYVRRKYIPLKPEDVRFGELQDAIENAWHTVDRVLGLGKEIPPDLGNLADLKRQVKQFNDSLANGGKPEPPPSPTIFTY
ncbi:MAG: hypothetical protein R3F49_09715 [Planctomycetota bacterium]